MKQKGKRFAFVIMASFGLVLLTGCVKFDLDLVVNEDSTISGTMIFAISDALASLGDTATESDTDVSDELIDTSTKGVFVEEYSKGGFTGQKIILDRVPFTEFQKGGDSGDLTISRNGNLVTLNGFLDLTMDEGDTDEDLFSAGIAKTFFSSADIGVRITFPFEVVSTTGELSENGKTVTWEPKIGDRVDLTTTVKVPSVIPIVPAVAVIIILLLFFGLVIVRKKRITKSNIEEATTEVE